MNTWGGGGYDASVCIKKKLIMSRKKKRKKKSNLKRDMWQKTLKSTMRYIHIKMILYSVRRERRYRNDRGTS